MRKWIKKLFCRHLETGFVRNIYGDEIVACGFKRSIWECKKCGKWLWSNLLFEPPKQRGWMNMQNDGGTGNPLD